jgi:hypothetical protein
MISDSDSGRNPAQPDPVKDRVDAVIHDLQRRLVGDSDREKLHKELDTADKPPIGRAAGDSALGRISRGL